MSSHIEPSKNSLKFDEFLNERRKGVFSVKAFNRIKRVPRHQSEPMFHPDEKYSTSFLVPPMNKYLKKIATEELKNDDNILAIFASLSSAFALAGNEETFQQIPESQSYVLYLRGGLLMLSIASVIWLIRRYQILLTLQVLQYRVSISDSLLTSGLYKTLLFEVLLHCIFSPPGLDFFFSLNSLGYTITYSLDDIFTFFTLLRLYTLLRLFGHYSVYTQPTAESICERNGESASAVFAIKSFIQDSPFIGIGVVFFSISLFSAVCLRIAERPEKYYPVGGETPSMIQTLADSLWVIYFTTTTVGYGNIYPVTHMGRLTCILACIFGNMYLGMLVVAIHQKMEHSDNENLAYAWIYRRHVKESARKYAKKAIRCAGRLYLLGKKWGGRTISRIKPNPRVEVGGVEFKFDMHALTEAQYLRKCQIYREMKYSMEIMSQIIKKARSTGQKDVDSIKLIDDTVKVDTAMICKKIQNMVTRNLLLTNSVTISAQMSVEKKISEVKKNAQIIRKHLKKAMRQQHSQDDSPLNRKFKVGLNFFS